MRIKSRLYNTIVGILSQHQNWLDKRHMYTLAWMVVGVIQEESINLTKWIAYAQSRAKYAQSTLRAYPKNRKCGILGITT